jgi:transposase-like protein
MAYAAHAPEVVARAEDLIRDGGTDGDIARELGVHSKTIYRWRRRLNRPEDKKKPHEQDRVTFLKAQIRDTAEDLEKVRKSGRGVTVLANLRKTMLQLRNELDDALKEQERTDDPEVLDDESYLQQLEVSAADWPDAHLEVLVRVYCERHRIPILGAVGED